MEEINLVVARSKMYVAEEARKSFIVLNIVIDGRQKEFYVARHVAIEMVAQVAKALSEGDK